MSTKTELQLFPPRVFSIPIEPPPVDDPDVDSAAWIALDTVEQSSIEVSVHRCAPALVRELRRVFDESSGIGQLSDAELAEQVLAVPTFQPSKLDLVSIGADIELEKHLKLVKFYRWCKRLCDSLEAHGYWADYIDPCSGYPVRSARGAVTYSEIDGLRTLLPYSTFTTGPCVVVSHPRWNTHCYPATMFVVAPIDAVERALEEISHAEDDNEKTNTRA
jgi:hypothetical protein